MVRYIVYRKNFVGIFETAAGLRDSFVLEVAKGAPELKVAAEDGDGLESEKSDVLTVEFN